MIVVLALSCALRVRKTYDDAAWCGPVTLAHLSHTSTKQRNSCTS